MKKENNASFNMPQGMARGFGDLRFRGLNRVERLYLKRIIRGIYTVQKSGIVKNNLTGRVIGNRKNQKYQRIGFKLRGKTISIYVHRLIWIFFKGPIPKGYQINHKNGKKDCNRLSNLELMLNVDNSIHAIKTGLRKRFNGPVGSKNGSAVLNERDIAKIKRLRLKGLSYAKIANKFDVHFTTIRNVVKEYNWKHAA